jgi:histidinol-phosphate phosphatase family protein
MGAAVFLDRDGVIIEEKGHLCRKEDISLIPDSDIAIKLLNKKGYEVVIVTNQPVVARGLSTLENVVDINNHLTSLLLKRGAKIDKIYFCPHHPIMGNNPLYTRECDCRKPKTGMLLQAEKDLGVFLKESYFIGDKTSDIKTGENAGCKTILVETGYGGKDNLYKVNPDYTVKDLLGAALEII